MTDHGSQRTEAPSAREIPAGAVSSVAIPEVDVIAPPTDSATRPATHDSTAAREGSSAQARDVVVVADDEKTVISRRPPLPDHPLGRAPTPAEMGRILVGEKLGSFELVEFVGGGGMGAVFRALDTTLNRIVAVKVLSREQTDEETLRRFQNEATNAARLDHERIARVYHVGEDKGWHFIVFEYIDGVNVRDLVDAKGPLPLEEALSYTLQVAEALRHAFRRDVVHRDIKPSNILVTTDGRAKLVDMGLARLHQVNAPQQDLTASGVTLGTFDYISPEQARDPRNADVRSDIYSLGCTLYYMLTGRPPFPDGTVLQKLLSHSTDAPPDPRLYRNSLPDEICRILTRMLAKNPGARYQTPDDLITDLHRTAQKLGIASLTGADPHWVLPVPRRPLWYEHHLPWLAPVLILIVGMIALEWFAGRPQESNARPQPRLLPALEAQRRSADAPSESAAPSAGNPKSNSVAKGWPAATQATASPASVASGASTPSLAKAEVPSAIAAPSLAAVANSATAAIAAAANALSQSAAEESTAPASAVIHTLIVGPSGAAVPAQSQRVPTLAAAVEAAQRLPELKTIELHFDGPEVLPSTLVVSPRDWTIRAAPDRNPLVVYRPQSRALADERRMLNVQGGRLSLEGIQFRMEIPSGPGAAGWSLLSLEKVERLALSRCGLTIANAGPGGELPLDNVGFIEVIAPAETETTRPAVEENPQAPVSIVLSATIARGEAMFVRSPAGQPFSLRWTQGLLITSQRLAEIGGYYGDKVFDRYARFDLAHVTLVAQEGLCLVRGKADARKHLSVQMDATNCIFLTNPSAPLIEHRTVLASEQLKRSPPQFKGQDNIFAGPNEYWRIVSEPAAEPIEPTLNIGFGEEGGRLGFSEPVPARAVMWKGLPPLSKAAHAQRKSDYLLSDDPANPALRRGDEIAGFEDELLPEFPADLPPPRESDKPNALRDGNSSDNGSSAASASEVGPLVSDKMKMMLTPPGAPPATKPKLEEAAP